MRPKASTGARWAASRAAPDGPGPGPGDRHRPGHRDRLGHPVQHDRPASRSCQPRHPPLRVGERRASTTSAPAPAAASPAAITSERHSIRRGPTGTPQRSSTCAAPAAARRTSSPTGRPPSPGRARPAAPQPRRARPAVRPDAERTCDGGHGEHHEHRHRQVDRPAAARRAREASSFTAVVPASPSVGTPRAAQRTPTRPQPGPSPRAAGRHEGRRASPRPAPSSRRLLRRRRLRPNTARSARWPGPPGARPAQPPPSARRPRPVRAPRPGRPSRWRPPPRQGVPGRTTPGSGRRRHHRHERSGELRAHSGRVAAGEGSTRRSRAVSTSSSQARRPRPGPVRAPSAGRSPRLEAEHDEQRRGEHQQASRPTPPHARPAASPAHPHRPAGRPSAAARRRPAATSPGPAPATAAGSPAAEASTGRPAGPARASGWSAASRRTPPSRDRRKPPRPRPARPWRAPAPHRRWARPSRWAAVAASPAPGTNPMTTRALRLQRPRHERQGRGVLLAVADHRRGLQELGHPRRTVTGQRG